ncbi:CUB and sushi domain-containing protein 3 [Branchiostoma belcheri]|nr:CUB and sushi domain-containing protein 3 [Branchiostoma belcheri]
MTARDDGGGNGAGDGAGMVTDCNGNIPQASSTPQQLTSPGYPNNYGNNLNCRWTIQSASGTIIHLHFIAFSLEDGYDNLNIFDGSAGSTPAQSLTGNNVPSDFDSSGNTVVVQFTSDQSVVQSGFLLEYTEVSASSCPNPGIPDDGQVVSGGAPFGVGSQVTFSCNQGFNLVGQPTITCNAGTAGGPASWDNPAPTCNGGSCGGTFVDASGTITSPGYPVGYGNNENCVYTISAPSGNYIRLDFQAFGLEQNFDFLKILEGGTETQRYSGQSLPPTYISSTNTVQLRFTSDASVTGQGFSLIYSFTTSPTAGPVGTCPDPGSISNGNRNPPPSGSTFNVGDTITYSCNAGFQLVGATTLNCTAGSPGTTQPAGWDSTPPTCQIVATPTSGTGCGGALTAPSGGPVSSPNYPSDYGNNELCEWSITVQPGSTIRLTFSAFNIESNYDFLYIYDGASDTSSQLQRLTGQQSVDPITSTSNMMFLRFTSDQSVTGPGFQFSYISITTGQCNDPGVPDNGNRDNDSNFGVGQTVTYSCSAGYQLQGTATITCQSNGMWSDAIPTCEASCGGTYTDQSGVINSPGYPNSYPNDAQCIWTILGGTTSSGTPRLIELTFNIFSLEANYDFVYVYDGYANGTVLNRFTGTNTPDQQRSTSNVLSIKMTTDGSVQQTGFQAAYQILGSVTCTNPGAPQFGSMVTSVIGNTFSVGAQVTFSCDPGYDLSDNSPITCQSNGQWSGPVPTCDAACGGQRTESSGTIQSPGYPGQYENNLNCEWVITSPRGAVVQLQFERLDLEDGYDFLEVHDGADGSSPMLQRLTGSNTPNAISSTGSSLYLKLVTDYSVTQTGFRATFNAHGNRDGDFFYVGNTVTFSCDLGYVISDATPLTCQTGSTPSWSGPTPTCDALCGGYLTATEGIVLSKNYPNNYGNNLNCNWTVAVTPGKGINFQFNTFSLEANYDYLRLYTGDDPGTAVQSYTGQTLPSPYSANYHIVFLVLSSDQSVSSSGFNISYTTFDLTANCAFPGNIDNGYNNQGSGQVFLVGESITYGCSPGYNLIGTATLTCVNGNPAHWNHPLPQCQAQCGGLHNGPIGNIVSPGYPNNYPNNLPNCAYEITVNPGEGIRLTITDFETAGPGDTLTIYDGTQSSPSLGTFSGNQLTPGQMFNSSSYPYTLSSECPDRGNPQNGYVVQITGYGVGAFARYDCNEGYTFQGNRTITCVRSNPQSSPHWDSDLPTCTAACGGNIQVRNPGSTGLILSPGYPGLYSNYLGCTWTLQAPAGLLFTLQFNTLDIETCGSDRSCSCDYLIIRDGDLATSPMAGGGRFCGQTLPPDINLNNTNAIRIEFHTDLSVTNQGFSIRYTSYLQTVCNDPGTPMNGSRTGGSSFSVGDTIYFQCDPGYVLSGVSYITCQGNSQAGVSWSGRTPTCEAPCGGRFTDPSGLILSPGYPSYPHSSDCTWSIVVQQDRVVELTFIYFQTETGYDYMNIYDGTNSSAQLGDQYTGHLSEQGNLPAPLRSSGNQMTIVFHSDSSVGGDGFQLRYQAIRRTFCLPLTAPMNGTMIGSNFNIFSTVSFSCDDGYELPSSCNQGGRCVLTCTSVSGTPTWDKPVPTCTAPCGGDRRPLVDMSEVIVSPNYPRDYDNSLGGCVWSISVDPAYVVHFEFVVFETEPQFDTLTIYNGPSSSSPALVSLSGTHSGENYLSTQSNVQMSFVTNARVTARGFHAIITAVHGTSTSYCQDPGVPEFGSRQGNNFAVGQSVTFSCDPGFVLNDTAVLVCETSSTIAMWNGTLPGCVGGCGAYITGHTSGYIYSPNYPGQYGNNQNCQWTVEASLGEGVKLTVESFILEESYDKLKIYDGGSANAFLLGEYTGTTIPREIRATSNMIYLVLTTDYSVTDAGFKIRYETYGLVSAPCPDPGIPDNGYRTGDSFVVDAVVSFGCNEGYTLVGHEHITCMPGNRRDWNYPPPTCEALCGGSLTEDTGLIYSPGWPGGYDHGQNCTWTITASGRTGIELRFQNFSLEQDYDYVSLYDGPTTNSPLLGRFTGQTLPPVLYSQSNEVVITLTTDSSVKDDGFALQYEAFLARDCVTPPALQNGHIIGTSYATGSVIRYECDEGFIVSGPPVLTCQQDTLTWSNPFPTCDAPCGANYTALSGTILSPGYPGSYGNQRDCRWLIMLPQGMAVQFSFDLFDVEDGYDYLTFREGLTTSLPVTVQLTGVQANDTYIPSNNVLVQLTSDYSVDGKFMMRYTGVASRSCPTLPDVPNSVRIGDGSAIGDVVRYVCNRGFTITGASTLTCRGGNITAWDNSPPTCTVLCTTNDDRSDGSGVILSPGYPNNYPINTICGWTLHGCNGHPVTLFFESFQSEARYDKLEVFDGTTDAGTAAVTYTGRPNPVANYTSPGAVIFLKWTSDSSITDSGFVLIYRSSCCNDPGIPDNGNRQGNSFNPNDRVTFSCNAGYTLVGQATATCQLMGNYAYEWTSPAPICQATSCGMPRAPANGIIDGNDFTIGSTVTYKCNLGYRLPASAVMQITCGANGWSSNNPPACQISTCPRPASVAHSTMTPSQSTYNYGDRVDYGCAAGYHPVGLHVLTCLADQTWDNPPPTCEGLSMCPAANPPNGGYRYVAGANATYNSVIQYTCNAGYNIQGSQQRQCQADGTWSGTDVQCVAEGCRDPGIPTNGNRQGNSFTYGSTVIYSCNEGFRLVGSSYLTCQSNREWNGEMPVCIPITCGDPGVPYYGDRDGDSFNYGNILNFTCNDGYILQGAPIIRCEQNGLWSNPIPTCTAVDCGDPGTIEHGHSVAQAGTTYGVTIEYFCDNGYFIYGSSSIRCQTNGQWDGTKPECRIVDCGDPGTSPNTNKGGDTTTTFGSTVTYICTSGHTIVSGDTSRTCQADGTWSGSALHCSGSTTTCGDIGDPPHGRFVPKKSTYNPNDQITFSCDTGYNLQGSQSLTCQSGGAWSSTRPDCIIQSCGDPGRPSNGNYNSTGFTYSTTVLFSCNPGYMLTGTPSKYCTATGEWKPDGSPICMVVNCGDPGIPANGVITGSEFTYGHFVTYTCITGHSLIGQANRTCQANGQWSNSLPACQVVNCGAPPPVPYSTVEGNSYTFGSSVSYNCSTGYRLIGPNVLTCRANGYWGSNLLGTTQCVPVSCGDPGVPANGQRQGSRFTFGSRVTFTCDEGYILIGTNQQQCMADGRWSPSSLPVCQTATQQSCRDPGSPDHGSRNATSFLPGAIVRFHCQDGYHILGPTSLICDPATLSWNGQPPTCVPHNCVELEAPDHANIVSVSDLQGQGYTTIFTCQRGYTQTSGDTIRVCQDNGQWSGKPIVCEVGSKPSEKPPTVLYPTTPEPKPTVPVQAFVEEQIWTGFYEYKGRKHPCTLTITAVLQSSFTIIGDFDDGSSSFTLLGTYKPAENALTLLGSDLTLADPSNFMGLTRVTFDGYLYYIAGGLMYSGDILATDFGSFDLQISSSEIPNSKPQSGKGLSGGSIAAAVLVPILCLAVLALGVYAWHLKRTGQRFSFFSRYGEGDDDASFENPCYNTAEGVSVNVAGQD